MAAGDFKAGQSGHRLDQGTVNVDRELNRASHYFRYVRLEREHHQEIFETGRQQMLESLKNIRVDPSQKRPPAQQPPPPPPENSNDDSNSEEHTPVSADTKKLYRKIVVETHPDKTDKMGLGEKEAEKRRKLYLRATEALRNQDVDTLVEIAVDLEVETGLDDKEIASTLVRRGKVLEQEIVKIRSSPEWAWMHSSEEKRVEVIREICKRNGWIYVTDDQIESAVRFATGVHPGSREDVRRRARELVQKRRQTP